MESDGGSNLTILNKSLSSFKVDLLANLKIEQFPGLNVDPSPPLLAVIKDDMSDATCFTFRYDGKSWCVQNVSCSLKMPPFGLDGGSGLQEVCM